MRARSGAAVSGALWSSSTTFSILLSAVVTSPAFQASSAAW